MAVKYCLHLLCRSCYTIFEVFKLILPKIILDVGMTTSNPYGFWGPNPYGFGVHMWAKPQLNHMVPHTGLPTIFYWVPSEKPHVVNHMGMPTSKPYGFGPQKPCGLGVGMPTLQNNFYYNDYF